MNNRQGLEPLYLPGSQRAESDYKLCRHRSTRRRPALPNRSYSSSDVQPAVFLKEMEKVIAIGNLAGDDLFLSLIIDDRESNLHRLIGRVLFGEVNEFYVEGVWS